MLNEKITAKIIAFFEDNGSIFNECIEDLDSYTGYLGDNRYYDMEMLNDFYCNTEPIELLNRAYFGHDEDTWHTDSSGNKIYGEFNPNRDFFTYNGYGNLVSSDHKDYSAYLDNYFIESLLENRGYLDISDDELIELLAELENE